MRRPIGHRTSTATDLSTILANQTSPAYMAAVARARHQVTDGHAWHYNALTGQWYLKPVLDGTAHEDAA